MLELSDVHTYYGDSHILQGVSLTVKEGELVALLGRNGAGKTTTVRSIIGFTPPRAGSVRFEGTELRGLPPHRIARLGLGLVPQGRRVFPNLTVRENLTLAARGRTGSTDRPTTPGDAALGTQDASPSAGWTVERVEQRFPRLRERRGQLAGSLSGGEQQQLAIARALMTNPRLLLLDEPSEGLAPAIIREVGEIIRELKGQGLALLLVEQNLPLALSLADRVYVLNKGQVVFGGTPEQLWAAEAVHRQYLGV